MILGSSHKARAGSGTPAQGEERVTDTCSRLSNCDAGLLPRHPCPGPPDLPGQSPAPPPSQGRRGSSHTLTLRLPFPLPPTTTTPWPGPPGAGRQTELPRALGLHPPHPRELPAGQETCKNQEGADKTQRRGHSGQDQNLEGEIEGVHSDGHPGQDLWGGYCGHGSVEHGQPLRPPWGCSLRRASSGNPSRAEHRADPSVRGAGVFRQPGEALRGGGPLTKDSQGQGTHQSPTQGPVPPLPLVLPHPAPQFPQLDKGLCLRAPAALRL